jgi:dienelactone hydrolase
MSRETPTPLTHDGTNYQGVLVSRRDRQQRPVVVLFPTVAGVSELELGFARQLVDLGYTGFVADPFGTALRGAPRETMMAAMAELRSDRARLLRLLLAIVEQVRGLGAADPQRIVVIGFCFGGLCALDVARSGADVAGAVSFHGVLDPPDLPPQPITARVIAYHGWDDPLAKPAAVTALASELTEAGADWQIHAFGHVAHGFTNPKADGSNPGIQYNALATERSWTGFINLLEELFGADA